MEVFEDTLIVNYSEPSQPDQIYLIRFNELSSEEDAQQTLDSLLDFNNMQVHMLEKLEICNFTKQ